MRIVLPWPPSVNTYWRHVNGVTMLSAKGRAYRDAVAVIVFIGQHQESFKPDDDLEITIMAYPPDRRRRDIDNLAKAILDGLQHATVYPDDYRISRLTIHRREVDPPRGRVLVEIIAAQRKGTT